MAISRRHLQDRRFARLRRALVANLNKQARAFRALQATPDVRATAYFRGTCGGLRAAIAMVDTLIEDEAAELEELFACQESGGASVDGAGAATSADDGRDAARMPSAEGAAGGWRDRFNTALVCVAFAALMATLYLLKPGE